METDVNRPGSSRLDIGELILAIAVTLFGLAMVWETSQIRLTPAYSKVGPRAIPYVIGAGIVVLGLWLAFEASTGRATKPSADSEDADPTLPTDWRTVGLLVLALAIYLLLLEPAGFIVASALLFGGAAFAMGSRRSVRDLAVGIILAVVLYLCFTQGLGLRLPTGIFERML
ncbi:MAG: tripartite tricarboxylate transporter TctB family protein [Chloroflexota bacterium]|nr:tripartite tricarboxylate transporter TctB family protein [Chloroflexota bacterium]